MTLYKTMVRPVVEYCSSVWYLKWKRDSQQIEKVQHRVRKFIPYLSHLPYQRRLQCLELPSLMFRRDRIDLINTLRIMKEVHNMYWAEFLQA